uniref:Uncharacterized protein n=1 Tax=Anguilla anguilla TaxID=7936 RepID=A0A0E9S848_ANGAN
MKSVVLHRHRCIKKHSRFGHLKRYPL